MPPERSNSFEERKRDGLMPAPDPLLKIRHSSSYQSRTESRKTSTPSRKHAETCGWELVPTLKHAGELNEKY